MTPSSTCELSCDPASFDLIIDAPAERRSVSHGQLGTQVAGFRKHSHAHTRNHLPMIFYRTITKVETEIAMYCRETEQAKTRITAKTELE